MYTSDKVIDLIIVESLNNDVIDTCDKPSTTSRRKFVGNELSRTNGNDEVNHNFKTTGLSHTFLKSK